MYLVVIGSLLLLMKMMQFGPVATWSWWVVLAPFPLAMAWWAWADKSGWTKRREMERMEAKKEERRRKNLAALGMDHRGRRIR